MIYGKVDCGQDLAKGLYDSYYVNFSTTLSRQLLEELASASLQSGNHAQIQQVRPD